MAVLSVAEVVDVLDELASLFLILKNSFNLQARHFHIIQQHY